MSRVAVRLPNPGLTESLTPMDSELLDPFVAQELPESVTSTLDDYASCARFNSTGRFIAAGRADGWATVWDIDTQGVLRSLPGHYDKITAVSWSRNSRFLLTASRDWNVVLWDLEYGTRVRTIRFDSPVIGASLHPKNCKILLAVLSTGQCYTVDTRNGSTERVELQYSPNEAEDEAEQPTSRKKFSITTARFSPDGMLVFVGTSRGDLLVYDLRSKQLVHEEKISNANIKHLEFSAAGGHLAICSSDRVVRIMKRIHASEAQVEMETFQKLQDRVGRTPWSSISWSGNGDYVIAGADHKAAHTIYIWDRVSGNLDKILEGPKEPLLDVHCHPLKSTICSVNTYGGIYIWSTVTTEKWGAFAAHFEELDENVEYVEREDEFDIEDEEVVKKRKQDEEEQEVDIMDVSQDIRLMDQNGDGHPTQHRWFDDDPDEDDAEDYFPPIFVESEETDEIAR
ncbi:WD40-repeat-containing domain protein [Cantharellus anzutake]|uniref:WD40-repeat-containing domain protein n=1 Tax=Cantharellus anzutake TaxID=1750568 RepID=UPI001902F6FC|nr:WD40-repeat-containing domain protein [Cantharellus anzutake]KAF8332697.1 WD40-repeat-containing domain protein [Cantharellus anzutake]